MCGRFTLRTPAHEVAKAFRLPATLLELAPRYNISPTQQVAAVRLDTMTEARQLTYFRWGLVPAWADDLSIGNRMINARGETVAEKPSFRKAFAARRCLILADGFYEWRKPVATLPAAGPRRGHSGKKTFKQPYYITMKDEQPFAFAGLWERNDRCGEPIESCTIITTAANALMAPLHDRMPVIVPHDHYDLWLDVAVHEIERLTPLLAPYDAAAMSAVPVSTLVNNPRNDSADCIVQVSR